MAWLWLLLMMFGGILSPDYTLSAAEPSTAGRTATVEMIEIEFRPSRVKIEPGERIRFVNKDPFEHTAFLVRADDPDVVVVPDTRVPPGESFITPPIDEKGVFILYCTIHGGMSGKVTTTGSFEVAE